MRSPRDDGGVTATLTARGVPEFDIISEAFQAAVEVPATLEPRTVHLTESDTSFPGLPRWGLLDAAERNGIALPSGCRVGQCESCALTVVKGTVAHLVELEGDAATSRYGRDWSGHTADSPRRTPYPS